MIKYMHYTNLATDQSNKIYHYSCWCYFDPHGKTTRISNEPQIVKKEKTTLSLIIAPEKVILRRINRKVEHRYKNWLDTQKL